jgi:hypothetical protein
VVRILFLVALLFIVPRPVHAYLDPGTGSYVAQILIATLLGGAVAFKSSWVKIKDALTGKKGKKNTDENSKKK